jgi:hypothetical protein
MRGLFDGAREVDAGDHREASHHGRLAGDGQAILVVQRRPLDRDRDVAFHQFGFVELCQCGGGAFLRLVDPDGLERSHGKLPGLALTAHASWPGSSRPSTSCVPHDSKDVDARDI